jgi:hypothetical protein
MWGFAEGFRKSFTLPRKNSRLLCQGLHNNQQSLFVQSDFFLRTPHNLLPLLYNFPRFD